jgi:hypothetical protein
MPLAPIGLETEQIEMAMRDLRGPARRVQARDRCGAARIAVGKKFRQS